MNSVITVENLGKKYTLSHQQSEPYVALRDVISDGIKEFGKRLFSACNHTEASDLEEFWALRDVSFDIRQGERIGVIGRNGAGKSTLLKILSRITEPTEGRVTIRGKVASLLEVGTGFHPELTGRENIFLNGAILGMSRVEIARKFDEIVAFAEIEKFLDTPVKRFSSGMYVRLAFAVAAHLEAEILLVDEVLAVGDAQFQKKCLGKMNEVSRCGRTIFLVSHNMAAIRQLCDKALIVANGNVDFFGAINQGIDRYIQSFHSDYTSSVDVFSRNDAFGISLVGFEIRNSRGETVTAIESGSYASVDFIITTDRMYTSCLLAITIDSCDDVRICALHNAVTGHEVILESPETRIRCVIPRVNLTPGRYMLTFKLKIADDTVLYLPKAFELNLEAGDFFGTGKLPDKKWGGFCLLEHSWEASHGNKPFNNSSV